VDGASHSGYLALIDAYVGGCPPGTDQSAMSTA
jgi:hypothetical protein